MTFVNPILLWWLLSLLLVPLLHLARRRPKRVLTPHIFLWERVLRTGQRTRIVRLKHWLLMLLQMLAIACVVILFAEPEFSTAAPVPRSTLIVMDLSPTMAALNHDGSSRLTEATSRAVEELESLLEDGPVALAALGDRPSVRLPFGSSRAEILTALDDLHPEWTLTDVTAVQALSQASEADRIWIITDRAFEGDLPVGVEVIEVGDRVDNIGIVAARLVEEEEGSGAIVYVELASSFMTNDVRVMARQGGKLIGEASAAAAGDGMLTFPAAATRGEFVEIRLDVTGGDALDLDNAVSVYWPEDPPFRVLVVADEVAAEHLDGLAALSEVCRIEAADHVTPERWREAIADYDLIILDGLKEKTPLPPASYLLINSYAPRLSLKAIEEVEDVTFLRRRSDVGILRGVVLEDLTARRATRIDISEDTLCLVEGAVGPLITARLDNPVAFVHVAFDITAANASLVLMDAWPLLLRDVLRVMHPTRRRLYGGLAQLGGNLVPTHLSPRSSRPSRSRGSLRRLTDGKSWPLTDPRTENVFRLPKLDPGEYEVELPGRVERIGLAPLLREIANISPRQTDPAATLTPPESVPQHEDQRNWLCIMALLLLACEWILYQRGWAS